MERATLTNLRNSLVQYEEFLVRERNDSEKALEVRDIIVDLEEYVNKMRGPVVKNEDAPRKVPMRSAPPAGLNFNMIGLSQTLGILISRHMPQNRDYVLFVFDLTLVPPQGQVVTSVYDARKMTDALRNMLGAMRTQGLILPEPL